MAITLISILLVSVAVACGSGSDDSPDGSRISASEIRITAASGGELRSTDNSFVLTVPPGAVSEDVTISFSEVSADTAPDEVVDANGAGFELKPEGLQFDIPAKVTLTLPAQHVGTGDSSGFSTFDLFSVGSDGEVSGLENVENEFDAESGELKLTGDLAHFSKLWRTKSAFVVSLDQIKPKERAVGSKWFVNGTIANNNANSILGVSWELETRQSISMTGGLASKESFDREADPVILPTTFTSSKASSTANTELQADFIKITTDMRCDSAGSGIYTISVSSRTNSTPIAANHGRITKASLSGTVRCVSSAQATTVADSSTAATAVSGILNATPTPAPTPAPTPTSLPNVGRGDEKLRLVVVAASGQVAPGASSGFTVFEPPSVGGGKVLFHGFMEDGTSGIWSFEEDELIGGDLSPLLFTVSPSENGNFAFIERVPVPVTESGQTGALARFKTDNDFEEQVLLFSPTGFPVSPVHEGQTAPGPGERSEFSQFYSLQLQKSGTAVFRANAGSEGLWMWDGSIQHLVTEGQALPGLPTGWKSASGKPVRSAGLTDDGTVLLYLEGYFHTPPNGRERTADGLWRIDPSGALRAVQTGMTTSDGNIFKDIFNPSMNSGAQFAFQARSETPDGKFENAIQKSGPSESLVKVATAGERSEKLGIELADVSSPLILNDGRVVFIASTFDSTNSIVQYILVESANGFEVLARTDALPGPNGTISAVPFGIPLTAANVHGHVAFQIGFGDQFWMQSPGGFLHRVIGVGDELDVPTTNGSTVKKRVRFAAFQGGVTTRTGQATGYSDDHHFALRVQFDDGTEAIVLATFDDPPIVP